MTLRKQVEALPEPTLGLKGGVDRAAVLDLIDAYDSAVANIVMERDQAEAEIARLRAHRCIDPERLARTLATTITPNPFEADDPVSLLLRRQLLLRAERATAAYEAES